MQDDFSSGHIFWEIMTCFMLTILFDAKVVYNDIWDKCKIKIDYDQCIYKPKDIREIRIDGNKSWGSIDFKMLEKLKRYKNVMLILENVWKIHPDILLVWEQKGLIKKGFYKEKFKPSIHRLYFSVNPSGIIDIVAIHLRRGDLYSHTYTDGYDIKYYQQLIETIKTQTKLEINIYTEKSGKDTTSQLKQCGDKKDLDIINHDDVEILSQIENVNLIRGDLSDLESHFNIMSRSRHLVLGMSSLSLIAGFISQGNIYVDNGYKKSRPNLFRNIDLIPNFQVFNSPKDIKILDD